jgi:hypothetical protein
LDHTFYPKSVSKKTGGAAAVTRETRVRISFFLFEFKGGTLDIGIGSEKLNEREVCPTSCLTAAQSKREFADGG